MKKVLNILVIATLLLTLVGCSTGEVSFTLVGADEIGNYVNTNYSEKGFIAKSGLKSISEYVTISDNIDSATPGNYKVTYELDYKGEIYTLERDVYYRDYGCVVIFGTDKTKCTLQWSQYLNTRVYLTFYYANDEYHGRIDEIALGVEYYLGKYHELSDKYNLYDGVTNVKTINNSPTTTHLLDEELYNIIKFALDHQSEVDNQFNIALGPVLSLWHDYRDNCDIYSPNSLCELPTNEALNNANQYTDQSKIVLDDELMSITMEANMSIDVGGLAKGYISGIITEYLDTLDITGYILNNGTSNISLGGTHPVRESGKYLIGVLDPTTESSNYAEILVSGNDEIVTSGDYQQYGITDGVKYHHIIDPDTLFPEDYNHSVTIITDDPGLGDLYSTAIFTMPVAEGIAFVNSIDGLEAIWYSADDNIYFSQNFEELYLSKLLK